MLVFLQNPPPITINAQNSNSVYQMTLQSSSLPEIYSWAPKLLAQMRTNQANSQLPSAVISSGVTVQQSTSSPLMLLALSSPKNTYDNIFLANYSYVNLNYALTRLPGVASVSTSSAPTCMP